MITCHENCIELTDDGIKINYETCSTCTHCIAVCPTQVTSWNHIPSERINTNILPTSAQVKEFLKSRRSDFHFDKRKIDRALLKDIATIGKYSPTNNYDMDAIIVDSPEIMETLGNECLKRVKFLRRLFFEFWPFKLFTKWFTPEFKQAEAKIKHLPGKTEMFSGAVALIIVVGNSRIRFTEQSAQYFLYNMQLYAKSLGIGSRPSGGGKMFLSNNKKARKVLSVPKDKSIQGILFLGYPSLNYVNKAEGIAPVISFK